MTFLGISIWTYVIVCPLVFLAGFVDSIAGGGGLISLPAYLIAGISPVTASATNKLSAFMGATVSFAKYFKMKYVHLRIAIPCIPIAILFASIGAKFQMMIPENILKIFIMIALPATLIFILNKKSLEPSDDEEVFEFSIGLLIKCLIIAMLMGLYDGIYGPGTGTFLIIMFVNIAKMNIKNANGLAKAINWATNCGSLLSFINAGAPIIVLGLTAGACNMIGSYIGSTLFTKKGVGIARPIMIVVILIFLIRIGLELLHLI